MCYVNSNIAREAGRLHGWRERFWGRRYQAIIVSSEEAAQTGRLKYLLSHGCKEGFVRRPEEWPGAHCVEALLDGKPLIGQWIDRTRQYEACRRGKESNDALFSTEEVLTLDPLPCWANLPADEVRRRIRALVTGIEQETVRTFGASGKEPLGVEAIRRQDPHQQPMQMKRSPAPLVHAASRAVRLELRRAYREFVRAFRSAAEKLRRGETTALFPPGCFPPRLPYVPDHVPT